MDVYNFGTTGLKVNNSVANRLATICREEGGHGYVTFAARGNPNHGWFTGPNRGDPFDRALARRVLIRVREEFPVIARKAWPYCFNY